MIRTDDNYPPTLRGDLYARTQPAVFDSGPAPLDAPCRGWSSQQGRHSCRPSCNVVPLRRANGAVRASRPLPDEEHRGSVAAACVIAACAPAAVCAVVWIALEARQALELVLRWLG